MMKNLKWLLAETSLAMILGGAVILYSTNAEAADLTETELEQVESGKSVYEDKIDISYLKKMVIHPEDDWIGKKVFKYNGVCMEVIKDLKIKKIKEPFKNLYRSANLPKEVEIGEMDVKSEVVDCAPYESKVTVLE
ncbi:hypothetical protein QX249_09340 [Vibrio parahaemolyticus]|uniref:Uncharacterized protein n=1 Tax=Vibrio parahaemolyticus TaxID=670 RepID=A0AAW8Q302_VIBPH|nr:hypothetical protein [Vibrio parahaemolyticus]EGR2229461.1 hypothetical protein [Vibrio parahaemolyticus]MDS1820858.1 hypothetical protein [Vibrio parahaemolyticus]